MGGRCERWLVGVGLASLFSVQSRGVGPVHASSLAGSELLEELVESVGRAVPMELLAAEPLAEITPNEEVEEDVVAPPAARMPSCDAELGLIAAVENERHPELSRVVLRMRGGAAVVAAGARIDRFIVDAVHAAGVTLRDAAGALCALHGFSPGVASEPVVERPPPLEMAEPTPRGKPVFTKEELADGLHAIGDGEYQVKRSFLLKALTNPGGSAGGAWFRGAKLDGVDGGMEVLGIRAGTALEAMGVHNGDVIRSLNGITLEGATGLISALRTAREADQVSISIVRDGHPRDLRYRVD